MLYYNSKNFNYQLSTIYINIKYVFAILKYELKSLIRLQLIFIYC